ncbi:putative dehydrogenase [Kineococcus radiotolerans]|uniref:Oxidoreductase domain protein n=2 Tax=Kineococcus radiotolerans TaxID=131568 RepID=A6W6N3_KINRD|nr:Gfo/Idh/MocA family oxidoreductase [Kineococcus radiotolerans]ABS02472.1 oxidoreductase domain protein [Kineococcus radiotolerans SRS30216 = ATCC BAA-149]MBB2900333.1 putative dehydrogenase [Kineococcus radiotolerans]
MSVGWGFVGTGGIARTVARALELAPGGRLVAVASRDLDRARGFAADQAAPGPVTPYDDVAGLLADPAVDAVYVATTHPQHHAPARAALLAGKAVLVEKPMTVSLAATRDLLDLARERSVFCMEAYWTRFLPGTLALLETVARGDVGEVLGVHADFGFPAPESLHRFHDPAIGGGSLFDLGPYPVGLALTLLGTPDQVRVAGSLGPTGVDRQVALALGWPSGAVAALSTTMAARTPSRAWIEASEGWIEVHAPLPAAPGFTVHRFGLDGQEHVEVHDHAVADGHRFVLEHVHECLAAGLTSSPLVPPRFSLDLAGVLEEAVVGLGVSRAVEVLDAD